MRGEESTFNTERRQDVAISYRTVRGAAYWAGFIGVWFIIAGILAFIGAAAILFFAGDIVFFENELQTFYGFSVEALAGAGAVIVGGIFVLVMGAKLRRTRRSLEDYIESGKLALIEDALNATRSFFKIQGILIILFLVLAVVGVVFYALTLYFFT